MFCLAITVAGCLCCVAGCLTSYFDCFVIWLVFIAMITWLARVGLVIAGGCWVACLWLFWACSFGVGGLLALCFFCCVSVSVVVSVVCLRWFWCWIWLCQVWFACFLRVVWCCYR